MSKLLVDTHVDGKSQWDAGNGQSIREVLLRESVHNTECYATDIFYLLKKIDVEFEAESRDLAFGFYVVFLESSIEYCKIEKDLYAEFRKNLRFRRWTEMNKLIKVELRNRVMTVTDEEELFEEMKKRESLEKTLRKRAKGA